MTEVFFRNLILYVMLNVLLGGFTQNYYILPYQYFSFCEILVAHILSKYMIVLWGLNWEGTVMGKKGA
jgi:hypothetical protein